MSPPSGPRPEYRWEAQPSVPMRYPRPPFLLAAAAAALLVACAPSRDIRGYVFSAEAVEGLAPGIDDRASVLAALGTPTTVATFDDNQWYYISRTTDTVAFRDPEVLQQKVVVVEFNERGLLAGVRQFDWADGYQIDPVERTTPTRGRELGILEQLIGNIGRYNPPQQ